MDYFPKFKWQKVDAASPSVGADTADDAGGGDDDDSEKKKKKRVTFRDKRVRCIQLCTVSLHSNFTHTRIRAYMTVIRVHVLCGVIYNC